MNEEPELHVIKFSELPGAAERHERRERDRRVARRRYHDYLAATLDVGGIPDDVGALVDIVLDALMVWNDVTRGEPCLCSCHPRLPDSGFHDFGFGCPCSQTPDDRRRHWDEWQARMDAFRESPEGRRLTATREAEEAALSVWLADHPEVTVRSHGGWAPEQWLGEVDGHSFYFRERHDEWRIELDLRPSGRFSNVWRGGPLDDDASFEPREIDEGDVIAEGTTGVHGYGTTPLDRLRFIVDTIRVHQARNTCAVHTDERDDLELLFGRLLAWCPTCGLRLTGPS